jgi:hypothetical protein
METRSEPADAETVTLPAGVNLTALPIRFCRICVTRISSLSRRGNSSGISRHSRIPFSRARGARPSITFSRTSRSAKGFGRTGIRPASILDRSRMSLISVSRFLPLRSMISR